MNIIERNWRWRLGTPSRRASTDYIALHHAAAKTCTAEQVNQWHQAKGWCGIGYHFFVRKDGSIYRGRPLGSIGAHVSGMNNCSLGICAEGDYMIEKEMPAAQKAAIKELLRYLKAMYPAAKIVGHREIGESDCPGQFFPIFEMKNHYNDAEEEVDMEEINRLSTEINVTKAHMAAMREKYDLIINKMGEEIEQLQDKVFKITPRVFDYIDDNLPDWSRPTVQKLVGNDVIRGDERGRLNLTYDMLRMLVMMDRAGLF